MSDIVNIFSYVSVLHIYTLTRPTARDQPLTRMKAEGMGPAIDQTENCETSHRPE
jgi:hypothetical protein